MGDFLTQNNEKQQEQQRVDFVVNEVDTQLKDTQEQLEIAFKERRKVESSYGDTAKVNTIEVDDQMETNAAIQQQKQLVALTVESETILENKEKSLNLLKNTPYFGRIDIDEDGEKESLYIGTSSLIDDDGEFLVYDWRAPISSLYYNGTLGNASYRTPTGHLADVELLKKRQFKIENGQITKMFDTNETVGDEMLQDVLNENSDTHLKNIVASVQHQQNKIIRDTSSDVLVVQGVAGSGKTSAILQRIAYLLYHSRSEINADQIILFSPNHLFSHYISEVLPSLGEKNMRQVTLSDFLMKRHEGFRIESLFDRFERDQHKFPQAAKEIRQFKESLNLYQALQDYLKRTPSDTLAFNDLTLNGEVVISQQEILKIYQQTPQKLVLSERFRQTKNNLIELLKKRVVDHAKSDIVEEQVENLSDSDFHYYHEQFVSDDETIDEERDILNYQLAKEDYQPLYDAIYNDLFIDNYQTYLQFLKQVNLPSVSKEAFNEMIISVDQDIENHFLRVDDAIAILYLRDLLTGSGQNFAIKHLFIDEMQDYSPLFMAYIRHCFPKAKLTLLGDYKQNIFTSYDQDTNTYDQIPEIFKNESKTYIELNTSYRCSKQITDFAKELLDKNDHIESFSRQGPAPKTHFLTQNAHDMTQYVSLINRQLEKYPMVAIITKTQNQAEALYQKLKARIDVNLLTQESRSLKKGLCILPIYLAKGLEFDSVIVDNVSKENYPQQSDREILYTIASRAMHELNLVVPTQLPTFLDKQKA